MSKREKLLLLCGGVLLLAFVGPKLLLKNTAHAERRPRTRFNADKFEPRQVVKPFPAIVNPPSVAAAEVNGRLQPTELVLGVEIEGMSRAYPINMLTGPSREIFNDTLGKHSIAATW